ncbi:hypothetical protein P7C70_g2951, partial [Phenoliferia sp. Uapishka_3]
MRPRRARPTAVDLPTGSESEEDEAAPIQPLQPEPILAEDDQNIVAAWELTPGTKRKFANVLSSYDERAAGGPAAELEPGEKQARYGFLTTIAAQLATLSAFRTAAPLRNLAPTPSTVTELTPTQINYVQGLTIALYLSASQKNYAPPNALNEGRILGYLKAHRPTWSGKADFFVNGSPAQVNLIGVIKNQLDQSRNKVLKVIAFATYGSDAMGGPAALSLVDGKRPSLYDFALEFVKPLAGVGDSHLTAPLVARIAFLRALALSFSKTPRDPDAAPEDELYKKVFGPHRFETAGNSGWSHHRDFLPYVDAAIESAHQLHNTPEKFSRYMKTIVKKDLDTSADEPLLTFALAGALPASTHGEEVSAEMMSSWPERIARPHITLPVRCCQLFAHDPTEEQWKALKHCMKTWGIAFWHDGKGFRVNSDATFASEKGSRKSRGGHEVVYNGPIAWGTDLQDDHALSSAESEFYASGKAAQVAKGLGNTAAELGIREEMDTIPLDTDNTANIAISTNPYTSKAIRHVYLRHHFLRDLIQRKRFAMHHLLTELMPADIFTKALGREEFEKKRSLLGMVDVAVEMGLRSP